jgi:hypothetical protein
MDHRPVKPYARKRRYSRSKPSVDLVATVALPPLSFSAQIPTVPAHTTSPTPLTLNVGDPAIVTVDMRPIITAAVEFIAEHPLLSLSVAAGLIWVICAANQQTATARSWT